MTHRDTITNRVAAMAFNIKIPFQEGTISTIEAVLDASYKAMESPSTIPSSIDKGIEAIKAASFLAFTYGALVFYIIFQLALCAAHLSLWTATQLLKTFASNIYLTPGLGKTIALFLYNYVPRATILIFEILIVLSATTLFILIISRGITRLFEHYKLQQLLQQARLNEKKKKEDPTSFSHVQVRRINGRMVKPLAAAYVKVKPIYESEVMTSGYHALCGRLASECNEDRAHIKKLLFEDNDMIEYWKRKYHILREQETPKSIEIKQLKQKVAELQAQNQQQESVLQTVIEQRDDAEFRAGPDSMKHWREMKQQVNEAVLQATVQEEVARRRQVELEKLREIHRKEREAWKLKAEAHEDELFGLLKKKQKELRDAEFRNRQLRLDAGLKEEYKRNYLEQKEAWRHAQMMLAAANERNKLERGAWERASI